MYYLKKEKEKKRRRKPPSAHNVATAQLDLLKSLNIPLHLGTTTCWACNREVSGSLEKAHIVPFSREGSDHPSNYLLLCHTCHTSQPDAAPFDYQMEWLRKKPQFWETKFEPLAFQSEFERMAGIKIEALCDLIIDKKGTDGMLRIFKSTLRGGALDKAGMTTGNAMANAVATFVQLYRSEYKDR